MAGMQQNGAVANGVGLTDESREWLRSIMDASPVAMAANNDAGDILYLNAAFVEQIGYRHADIPTLAEWSPRAYPDPTQRAEVMGAWAERLAAYRQGRPFDPVEAWVRTAGGGELRMRISAADLAGPAAGLHLVTLVDVTTIRAQESELEVQHRRLSAILEGTHVGTWEWDVQTGEVVFNERWAEILGYRLEELAPISLDTWLRLAHPDDLKISEALIARHFAGELPYYDCEARMRHKDGHWVWVQDRGKVASWTADGKPLLMSGTHQDITERKMAEVERERLQAERTRLLQVLPVGVYRWRASAAGGNRFEFVSDLFCEQLGFSREALMADSRIAFDAVLPEDLEDFLRGVVAANRNLAPLSSILRIRRADGIRWLHLQSVCEQDGDDVVRSGIQDDITERKRAELELENYRSHLEQLVSARTADLEVAKEAAEAASRAKTSFLSIASHELRTPMNGVMGMIALARRRVTDPKTLDYLAKADGASNQLLRVINDVLDISKIEADKLTLASVRYSVTEVSGAVRDALEVLARNKDLALAFDLSEVVRQNAYLGDPTRLTQILTNLVGNAIKFTLAGSVLVAIDETAPGQPGSLLCVEVSDTGPGIAPEDCERIFEPFTQVDQSSTRRFGGTGLGLALCKRIVLAMHGRIGVDSTPGAGSRFWFEIPARHDSAPPNLAAADDVRALEQRLRDRHSGAAVLIVEDEPASAEIIRTMLEGAGLTVFTAVDGVEAVEHARSAGFKLILMDMKMPRMSGIEATREIRRIPSHALTPIVAITANAFVEDRDECFRAGMNDHLGKPTTLAMLYKTVLRWLEPAS